MQTILGANGQIADELAKELHGRFATDIRLVSRNPRKVNAADNLHAANLLDAEATSGAVKGSQIAYLTVGLPMDSRLWEEQFPVIMRNVIAACRKHACKLVFFDNTYMYAKTSEPQTEKSPFAPVGRKSNVRAKIAEMLLGEMAKGNIEAVICRAPEFYGSGRTQSLTNTMIFEKIRAHARLNVPMDAHKKRTLIWTPDASRAMALIGNSPEAFHQTWHLPCDDNRLTYAELIALAENLCRRRLPYRVLGAWVFKLAGLFQQPSREIQELLPRYQCDNIFISDRFKQKFPGFKVTTYQEGMSCILNQKEARR